MRTNLLTFLFIIAASASLAAPPAAPANARTIKKLPGFPIEELRSGLGAKLYKSLEISPVEAWVVARASIYNGHTANAKIIHSEANGLFDKMLLEMANGRSITGQDGIESRMPSDSLTVHLLVYKIADGFMAVCCSHNDDARYVGYQQSNDAWAGILKNGKWITISRERK